MEYPSEEYWEVDDYYSQPYETKGKLGWIWRKSVNLGKKIVVTGVVISSAPFVLPPLMALSALGIAVSVPAGLAVATYACSEKLLDKLLPSYSPSSPVEDDGFYGYDGVEKGYEEGEDMDAEEREFEEDMRKEVEMRIELVEEEDDDKIDDYEQRRVSEIVEEGDYREEKDGYVEDDEEKPLDVSGISDEEMRRETTGLLEEIRDEGRYDHEKSDIVLVEETRTGENEGKYDHEKPGIVSAEETTTGENEGKYDHEKPGIVSAEETRTGEDEGEYDRERQDFSASGENEEIPIEDVSENQGGESELFVIPEEVKPGEEEEAEGVKNEYRSDDYASTDMKYAAVEKKLVVQVKTSGDRTSTEVRLETSSDEKRKTLIIARKTAEESGHAVAPSSDQTTDSVNKTSSGVHEVPIEAAKPLSQHFETTMDQHTTAVSGKVNLTEEKKIWEQICAMRTIVGYKAAPQSTCAEELEALYIFTGVEPPASSKDHVDLTDVNEKLHSLMSIVGVK